MEEWVARPQKIATLDIVVASSQCDVFGVQFRVLTLLLMTVRVKQLKYASQRFRKSQDGDGARLLQIVCNQNVICMPIYYNILASRLLYSTTYVFNRWVMATQLLGSITSSVNHEHVKGNFVPSQECMVCMEPRIVHWHERNERMLQQQALNIQLLYAYGYNPSVFIYTKQ